MKRHKTFNKDEYIYCLLSSYDNGNVLIPAKCYILDVKWHNINPLYTVKILEFYDNFNFLKRYLKDSKFRIDYSGVNRVLGESLNNINSKRKEDLVDYLNNNKIHFIVDSIMCTGTKEELDNLFNKIQFYLISKYFTEIRELSIRNSYKGMFKMNSNNFNKRFECGFGDIFDSSDIKLKDYLLSITKTNIY